MPALSPRQLTEVLQTSLRRAGVDSVLLSPPAVAASAPRRPRHPSRPPACWPAWASSPIAVRPAAARASVSSRFSRCPPHLGRVPRPSRSREGPGPPPARPRPGGAGRTAQVCPPARLGPPPPCTARSTTVPSGLDRARASRVLPADRSLGASAAPPTGVESPGKPDSSRRGGSVQRALSGMRRRAPEKASSLDQDFLERREP
jgi:hypothetical protein